MMHWPIPGSRDSVARIILFVILLHPMALGGESIVIFIEPEHAECELMHYKLSFSFFQVGEATISCEKDKEGCVEHIRVEARSNGLVKVFNNMCYILDCSVDPHTGLPDSAVIDLVDRKNSFYNVLVFDHDESSDSTCVRSLQTGDHALEGSVYEVLTGFYYFRGCLGSKEEFPDEFLIRTFYPDKRWDLTFTYSGDDEIKTPLGPAECYLYHPSTVAGRFLQDEDDMTVWFTKADPHIPAKFHLDLRIGSIKGELEDYKIEK